jgi:hypothetical protein
MRRAAAAPYASTHRRTREGVHVGKLAELPPDHIAAKLRQQRVEQA